MRGSGNELISAMPTKQPRFEQRLALRDRPSGVPVMRQRWADFLFLHWPVDASLLQERLPNGLYVDTYQDQAWLGIVPFSMERIRPTGLPPLPWLSWFLELNVRTYVYDESGTPGVWFFSLECNQPLAVEIARRFFHLPYQHAAMRREKDGGDIRYQCQRKNIGCEVVTFNYEAVANPAPASAESLEWFLLERYLLFSCNRKNEIFSGRVHHTPYQFSAGTCGKWSTAPLAWNGFPEISEPPVSVINAAAVDVTIYPLRKC